MISNVKANPQKGLMAVTFGSNGAVVVYDHVPREIIAELQYIAQSGGSLGRLFWDLVRQRGTGATKYPYWTAKEGTLSALQQARMKQYNPEEQQALKVRVSRAIRVLNDPLYQEGVGESAEFTDRIRSVATALSDASNSDDFAAMEAALKRYKGLDLE
jgi:hypothetical protein